MFDTLPATEGFIEFHGFHTWYRAVGAQQSPDRLPLFCLHGGPGAGHAYLEPLEAMARTGRRVIFYDQLGCGLSDHPHAPQLWTVQLYIDELAAIRQALGLEHVHILGQSWGGMLAQEYALTQPAGLASLILADSLASIPHWMAEANRLRAGLPPEVQATLLLHEQAGTTDDPAYGAAVEAYYQRHLCRLDPLPECVTRTNQQMAEWPEVYETMWGPNEFNASGTLKEWDITQRLGEIRVPTLVLGGRFDEATPAITEVMHRGIAGSEYVIFEQSAHLPHVEETELYMQVLGDFLDRVESERT